MSRSGKLRALRHRLGRQATPDKAASDLRVETLEPRLLLSANPVTVSDMATRLDTSLITGVTVITHGFQPEFISDGDSLLGLGRAIVNFGRNVDTQVEPATGIDPGAWLLDYDLDVEGDSGIFDLTQSELPPLGGRAGELVLVYDWAVESNEHAAGWTEAAGEGLFSLLAALDLVDPAHPEDSKPLHFIAHSFGAAVTSEAVERLGYYGVEVDQVTLLDPHDFDQGLFGFDTAQDQDALGLPLGYGATRWSNVGFMDVYFQTRNENSNLLPDSWVPAGRPIPGAYNRFLDVELPVSGSYGAGDASGDHTYAWSAFYASTIPGAFDYNAATNLLTERLDIDNDRSLDVVAGPTDRAGLRQNEFTGFSLSRLAHGESRRPAADFYGLAADDQAAHRYTPADLRPLSNTEPGHAEPVDAGVSPVWTPFGDGGVIFNGDLEFRGESALPGGLSSLDALDGALRIVPGWTGHGGGGVAQVPTAGANAALRLTATESARSHNFAYLPASASHFSAALSAQSGSTGTLEFFLADDTGAAPLPGQRLGAVDVATLATTQTTVRFALTQPGLLDQTHTLLVRLTGAAATTQVQVDDVAFESLATGRSADILWLDLRTLAAAAGKTAPAAFDASLIALEGARLVKLADDEFRVESTAQGATQVLGRILLAERFGRAAFAGSGQFAFVPDLPDALNETSRLPFSGVRSLAYGSQGFLSLMSVRDDGTPPDDSAQVLGDGSTLDLMRLQQRLRALGYPGVSGNALVVDGRLGPNTRHAIGLFNAVVQGRDSVAMTDRVDLSWINDPAAPAWRQLTGVPGVRQFATGNSQWGGGWVADLLAGAGARLATADALQLTQAALKSGGGTANGLGRQLVFETGAINPTTAGAGTTLPYFVTVAAVDANGPLIAGLSSTLAAPTVLVRNAGGQVVEVSRANALSNGNRPFYAWQTIDNVADLLAIKGRFQYTSEYNAPRVTAQIRALQDAARSGDTPVNLIIYSGDPGTWTGDGTTGAVRFTSDSSSLPRFREAHRGGTFEVHVQAPVRRLSADEQLALSRAADAADTWFSQAALDSAWSLTAPLVQGSVGQWLPLADVARKLVAETLQQMAGLPGTTLAGIEATLRSTTWTIDAPLAMPDGSLSTQPFQFKLTPGSTLRVEAGPTGLRLQVQLQSSSPTTVRLGLDDAAARLGVALTGLTEVPAQRRIDFGIDLDLLTDPALAPDQAVRVNDLWIEGSIALSAPDVDASLRIGGMAGRLEDGRIDDLSFSLRAGLRPGSGGSLADLAASTGNFVVQPGQVHLKAELPLVVATGIAGTVGQTISVDRTQSLSSTLPVIDLEGLRFGTGAASIGLPELGALDTASFLSLLSRFGDWLQNLGGRLGDLPGGLSWPNLDLPALGTLNLPDIGDLLHLGGWIDLPTFDDSSDSELGVRLPDLSLPSWQDLAGWIPGFSLAGLRFDVATRTLTYRLDLDRVIEDVARLQFGASGEATPAPLAMTTRLADLNGGRGIAGLGSALPSLVFSLADGTAFDVDFDGITADSTLADVAARIELRSRAVADLAASRRVQVRLSDAADRLVLVDLTPGTQRFMTSAAPGAPGVVAAGTGLGLVGEDTDDDGIVRGAALNGAGGTELAVRTRLQGSFTIGIDFAAVGEGFELTSTTPLSSLNRGARLADGIGSSAGDDLLITFSDGSTQAIDLDPVLAGTAPTVQNVIQLLLDQAGDRLAVGVRLVDVVAPGSTAWDALDPAARAAAGDTSRFWLRDLTSGTGTFRLEALNGSLAALPFVGLGLVGEDADGTSGGDHVIAGTPLHGDAIEDHFFVQFDATDRLRATVELAATDIDLRLALAGVSVGVQNGSALVRGQLDLRLVDPGSPVAQIGTTDTGGLYSVRGVDGRITLAEMLGSLAGSPHQLRYGTPAGSTVDQTRLQRLAGDLTLRGNLVIDLPVTSSVAGLLPANAGVRVDWTDLSDAATTRASLSVRATGLDVVSGLSQFAYRNFIEGLREVRSGLGDLEGTALFQQQLPVIGKSLADLVGLGRRFDAFIEALERQVVTSPVQIGDAIAKALSDMAADGDDRSGSATVRFDAARKSVFIDLGFAARGQTALSLDVDLAELGRLAGVSGLQGDLLSASGRVLAAYLAELTLALEVDLANPVLPVFYLRDTTKARFGLGLYAGDIDAQASLGPLGLFVENGKLRLDKGGTTGQIVDNDADTTVDFSKLAFWNVALLAVPGPSDRYGLFGGFGVSQFTVSATGRLDATLPVFFPTPGTPLDPSRPALRVTVTDLDTPTGNTTIVVPDFGTAATAIGDLSNDLGEVWNALGDGWQGALAAIDRLLDSAVLSASLPLVGDQLRDALTFAQDLRDRLEPVFNGVNANTTAAALRQALVDAMGSWLANADGVTLLSDPSDPDRIEFAMPLHLQQQLASADLGFDLGLPGLGLDLQGNVRLDVGFDWNLRFGLSKADGFYLLLPDGRTDDLTLSLKATLPGFLATGELGILRVTARDDSTRPSALTGAFVIDLKDPTGDGHLTIDDLTSSGPLTNLIGARFDGEAHVHLGLETSLQGSTDFPRIRADLLVDWQFANAATGGATLGNRPSVVFDNVQVNAGDFINGVLGPVLRSANAVLDPMRPAIDLITSPIPGLSQLAGRPVTLIDVARAFGSSRIAKVVEFIDEVVTIDQLVRQFQAIATSGWIDLGEPPASGQPDLPELDVGALGFDLRLPAALSSVTDAQLDAAVHVRSAADIAADFGTLGAGNLMNTSRERAGFKFPAFERPASLLGLLIGRDVKLVEYTTPHFSADLQFVLAEIPILPPVLFARIQGAIGFEAQLTMGFDTVGLRRYIESENPADLLDGFYIADLDASGRDVTELKLYGEIGVYAALPRIDISANFGIVAGGISVDVYAGGGIRAVLGFNLNDPDRDGLIRWNELASNFALGANYIFDINGRVDFVLTAHASIRAWIEINYLIGSYRKSWTVFNKHYEYAVPLLNYDMPRPDNTPVLAQVEGGLLRLNVGDRAALRRNGDRSNPDESVQLLAGTTPDSVIVAAFGMRQTFTGVRRISVETGTGNDTVQIGEGLSMDDILVRGGSGNDVLVNLGAAPVRFFGDDGEDRLIGGRGADLLDGGSGDDVLTGNAGDDQLDGGYGADQLLGGAGNDTLHGDFAGAANRGDADHDVIFGDAGNDTAYGGFGNDRIVLGAGQDTAFGGAGQDLVDGGSDNDQLAGEDDDDRLVGGDGDDRLQGGRGQDHLQGDRGRDDLAGGLDADTLWGGLGNDTADGGEGDDVIFGGEDALSSALTGNLAWGSDLLIGGLGSDRLYAGAGAGLVSAPTDLATIHGDLVGDSETGDADVIHGGLGADLLAGGGGDDVIVAYGGADQAWGGAGGDDIDGGDGDDLLVGEAGADALRGGAGFDVVWGGHALVSLSPAVLKDASQRGLASVLALPPEVAAAAEAAGMQQARIVPTAVDGQSVRDDVRDVGDAGDRLAGGADRDWLFGGAGADVMDGGTGEDYLDGGAGDDLADGGADADLVRGGDDNDTLHGGDGIDLLHGEQGNDRLYADARAAVTATTTGQDGLRQQLWGGDGDDYLFAWSDVVGTGQGVLLGDALHGGVGRDFIYGGLRQDMLWGDDGHDVLMGDAVGGNDELSFESRRLQGGRDQLFGGAGDDMLEGGGGGDTLRGGGGADRLEGNSGSDSLFGEAGGDVLVVDLDPAYITGTVDRFDGHGDPTTVDSAIDRVLIAGTEGDDTLLMGESVLSNGSRRLLVQRSTTGVATVLRSTVEWRVGVGDPALALNTPRIDQFHLAGLGGNDTIRLANAAELGAGTETPDLAALGRASSGWVMVVEGGQGNDQLSGSAQRDYIDGGAGSDRLYGQDGDDQIWGDTGQGQAGDIDQLFGGRGNDDLYGGSGRNELFAWSINPYKLTADGRYANAAGGAIADPFDLSQRVWLGVFTQTGTDGREVAVQGPVAGNAGTEVTGLNRVIGGDGDDHLYGGRGLDFLSGGTGANSFFGRIGQPLDALGDVAVSADPERNLDANEASGYWYYAGSNARDQIRVDFVTEPGLLVGHHLITRLTQNGDNFTFDASVRLDFTAQTTAAGKPLWSADKLVDSLALLSAEDVDSLSSALVGGAEIDRRGLISTLLPPEDDFAAIFIDAMAGDDEITVGPTVQKSVWTDAGSGNDVVRIEPGSALLIDTADRQGNTYAGRNDTVTSAYELRDVDTGAALLQRSLVFADLTLDSPSDVDWFRFELGTAVPAAAQLRVRTEGADDRVSLTLYRLSRDANGVVLATGTGRSITAVPNAADAALSIAGLGPGEYLVKVLDDRKPTRYHLAFDFADGVNLADRTTMLGRVVSLLPRRDLAFGGAGNDTLIGGGGEDYLSGGDGNDVLSGGADRQAVDVLDGGLGDDTFQIWTDAPAVNRLSGLPITEPGYKSDDLFIGGSGTDRVLFLGTDAPDFAALAYNAQAGRYALTARTWDLANNRYLTDPTGAYKLEYAFFSLRAVEAIQADLGASDDEFHVESGYRMAGDPDPGREWGIAASARPLGAPVDGVTIFGGTGNDRLFGGAGRDWIDGGAGRDLLAGGQADDELYGGDGDDLIAGDTPGVLPDSYETGRSSDRSNDNLADAHAIRLVFNATGVATVDGSFHAGDGDDWYLVEAPYATRGHGPSTANQPDLERAVLNRRAVSVASLSGAPVGMEFFAARVEFDASGQVLTVDKDVNDQLVAPSHYLVRVFNSTRTAVNPSTATYRLSIDLSESTAAIDLSDAANVQQITQPNVLNRLLPAGDLDGDGRTDFLAGLRVNVDRSEMRTVTATAPAADTPWLSSTSFLDITPATDFNASFNGPLAFGVANNRTLTVLEGGNFDRWDARNPTGQLVESTRDEVLWVETTLESTGDYRTRVWVSKTTSPYGLNPVNDKDRLQLVGEFLGAPVAAATLGDVDRDAFVDAQGIARAGVDDLGILAFKDGHAWLHLYSGRGLWTNNGLASKAAAVIDLGVADAPPASMRSSTTANFRIFDAGDVNGDGVAGDFVINTSHQTWFLKASTGWQKAAGAPVLSALPTGTVHSTLAQAGNPEIFRIGDIDSDGRQDYVLVSGDAGDTNRGWTTLLGSAITAGSTTVPSLLSTTTWHGSVDVVALGNFTGNAAGDFAVVGRAAAGSPYVAIIHDGSQVSSAGPGEAAQQLWLGLEAATDMGGPGSLGPFAIRPANGLLANWVVPLGDVNGDGRADLVVATGRGTAVPLLLGSPGGAQSVVTTAAATTVTAARPLAGTTALPLAPVRSTPTAWTSTSLATAPTAYGNGEFGAEGALALDPLGSPPSLVFAQPVAIGDLNGDGQGDFLLPHGGGANSVTRIAFGPVTNPTWDDLDDLGDVLLPGNAIATPDHWGNIDRDAAGTNDLVWAVNDGGFVRVNVRFGGGSFEGRELTRVDRSFLTEFRWQAPQPTTNVFETGLRTPGTQISVGDFDGDGWADILVKGDSNTSSIYPNTMAIYKGRVIAESPQPSYFSDKLLDVSARLPPFIIPLNNFSLWRYSLDAQFVGDVTGDGRVDLVVTSPIDLRDTGNIDRRPIGAAYLIAGRDYDYTHSLAYLDSVALIASGQGVGGGVHRLGDVNGDGIGDFALSAFAQFRESSDPLNNFGLQQNQVEVYLGSANQADLVQSDSSFIGQFGSPGTFSQSTVTTGDFNADGALDLAIGTPLRFTTTDSGGYPGTFGLLAVDRDGRVDVFYGNTRGDLWTLGAANANRPPSVSFSGRSDELLGVLWKGPAADVDGDNVADLLIGRPGADRTVPDFVEDAGGFTLLRGFERRASVDAASGLPANPLALPLVAAGDSVWHFAAGQTELWARVTTQGDGIAPDGFTLLPAAGNAALNVTLLRLSTDGSRGAVFTSGAHASLARLAAGDYLLRLQRTDATAALDAVLTAELPLAGRNLVALRDSDRLFGQAGNDGLVGGADVDRLYGGLGNDRFNLAYAAAGGTTRDPASFEARDRNSRDDTARSFSGGTNTPIGLAQQTDPIVDPVIWFGSSALGDAVNVALGRPVGSELRRSQVLALTSLSVTVPATGALNLSGLETLTQLRRLTITPNGLPGDAGYNGLASLAWTDAAGVPHSMRELTRLVELSLANNAIDRVDLSQLPARLQRLDLSGNRLQSVQGLTGHAVADDLFGSSAYTEAQGAVWMLGRQSPAIGGDYRFTDGSAASAGAEAVWQLQDALTAGSYRLHVTWPGTRFNALLEGDTGFNQVLVTVETQGVVRYSTSIDQVALAALQGASGRPWLSLGDFNLPTDAALGQAVVRFHLQAGTTMVADAVMLERVDRPLSLPALQYLNLSGNLFEAAQIDAQRAVLMRQMTAASAGGTVQLVWPDAATPTAILSLPGFIEGSGSVANFPTVSPIQTTGSGYSSVRGAPYVYRWGVLDGWADGVALDQIQFNMAAQGDVLFELESYTAAATNGSYIRDAMLRLFRLEPDGSVVAVTTFELDDGNPTFIRDTQVSLPLDAGNYRLFIGSFNLDGFDYDTLSTFKPVGHTNTFAQKLGGLPINDPATDRGAYKLYLSGSNVRLLSAHGADGMPLEANLVAYRGPGLAQGLDNEFHVTADGSQSGLGELVFRADDNGVTTFETIRTVFNSDAPQRGMVYGTVFQDSDGDSLFGAGESGKEGVWVGIDTNGDGSLQDEARRVGAWTDYAGRYAIDLAPLAAGGLPATSRVVVEDPLWRQLPTSRPTLTDTRGGLSLTDVIGPRDLGVTEWGNLPAVLNVADGQSFQLDAPAALDVGGTVRTDLVYQWRLYAAEAANLATDLGAIAPLYTLPGAQFSATLPHTPLGYRLVLAAFDPAADTSLLANALITTSVEIHTSPVPWEVTLPVALLDEGQPLRIDWRTLMPGYTVPPGLPPSYEVVTDGPATALDAARTGWVYNQTTLPSGNYAFTATLRSAAAPDAVWAVVHGTAQVNNLAPKLTFATPAGTYPEGRAVKLTPTSWDSGGDTLAYLWTVTGPAGQSYTGTTKSVDFTPRDNGSYVITYTVSDAPSEGADSAAVSLTRTMTVTNAAPTAAVVTVTGRTEAQPVQLLATITDPGLLDTHRFSWTVRDAANVVLLNQPLTTSNVLTFIPPKDGLFRYEVVATDNGGATSRRTGTFTIDNAPPALRTYTLRDGTGVEGQPLSFTVDAVDVDALTYLWRATLGTVEVARGTAASFSFTPADQGDYRITLDVTDNVGARTSLAANVLVANAAPLLAGIEGVTATGIVNVPTGNTPLQSTEGSEVFLRVPGTDVAADPLSHAWQLLDAGGTVVATFNGATPWQLPPLQAGRYTARVSVADGDGGVTISERLVEILNLQPTWVAAPANVTGLVLGAARLQGSIELRTLGTALEQLSGVIDYGDGVVESVILVATPDGVNTRWTGTYDHTYTRAAPSIDGWQASITVRDDESALAPSLFRVGVVDGPRLARTGGNALPNLLEGSASSWTSYRITLSAAPTSDVVIELYSASLADADGTFEVDGQLQFWDRNPTLAGAVAITSVRFTPTSWSSGRTVYVTARNDNRSEATSIQSRIVHRVVTADARVNFQINALGRGLADLGITTLDNSPPAALPATLSAQSADAPAAAEAPLLMVVATPDQATQLPATRTPVPLLPVPAPRSAAPGVASLPSGVVPLVRLANIQADPTMATRATVPARVDLASVPAAAVANPILASGKRRAWLSDALSSGRDAEDWATLGAAASAVPGQLGGVPVAGLAAPGTTGDPRRLSRLAQRLAGLDAKASTPHRI